MAYSTGRQQCALDDSCKHAAVYNCRGCGGAFCCKHVADHRRILGEEMNSIVSEHNHLKNIFTQHESSPNQHPLIKWIDEWEQESIEKIKKKANELREELMQPTAIQINQLSRRLEPFSEQLNTSREQDDFIETDLSLWKGTFDLIKSDLTSPLNFTINHDEENPLVRNLSIILKTINERFDQVFDDKVRILEDGEVVIHDGPSGYKEIRGRNEYSSGCHKIRLRIESAVNVYTFLGINSKETPLQSNSYSPKSAYLWRSDNYIYVNGSSQYNNCNPPMKMNKNDIITLTFDCTNRKISIINESTNAQHSLNVDVDNCPFPWQLHVNMYNVKECVRILPS